MAACRYTLLISSSTLFPSYSTSRRVSLKVIRCSSVSNRFPLKSSKRKNYLRPKILRTLNPKPHETDLIKIKTPEDIPPSDLLSNKTDVVEELQISSSSVASSELNSITGKLSPEIIAKYGWYLLGIFAFQTVCAVLFLGDSTKSLKTPEISNDSSVGAETADSRNSSSYRPLLVNRNNGQGTSNVIILNELEMNEKIAEIRVMAREARKSEEKSDKKELEDSLNPSGGMDIEKEIGTRLANMKKQLNSQRKGLAGLRVESVNELRNADGRKMEKVKGNEENLIFEKKYKFKSDKPSNTVKGFGGSKRNNEVKKQSDNKNRIWWLKLPYVLRILMRSNIDQEISEGYFTMKSDEFVEHNGGQVSYIVAFEDQIDARNFCYLLESFFEDLGDFSADVVPISTKDLDEEVSSSGKNVVVVKKKQLALYAGQPFEDVERALRDLIKGQ